MLARMRGENPQLLLGLQTGVATMQVSVKNSQRLK